MAAAQFILPCTILRHLPKGRFWGLFWKKAIDDKQLAEEIKQADANAARAEAELKIMQNGQSSPNNGAALAAAQQQYEQASAKEAKMASLYKIGAIARRQYEAASAEKSAALAALNAAQNAGSLVKASPEAIAQKHLKP